MIFIFRYIKKFKFINKLIGNGQNQLSKKVNLKTNSNTEYSQCSKIFNDALFLHYHFSIACIEISSTNQLFSKMNFLLKYDKNAKFCKILIYFATNLILICVYLFQRSVACHFCWNSYPIHFYYFFINNKYYCIQTTLIPFPIDSS